MPEKEIKTVAQNRKARHDYFVEESFEAGIELRGTEVKSIRLGKCNLKDCYAQVEKGEMMVFGMHISPYEKGNIFNTDPMRPKKLLMHKAEIRKLEQQVMLKGLTLIPLSVYLKNGRMKVQLGLCKGKKNYDKRDDIAKRDADREIERSMRRNGRE
ncbi:MAG: SsrA-binding protein SmpB [Clostridia bacterium]|nr:SsrA-binding protein SmpB [Clostridia bacterium]